MQIQVILHGMLRDKVPSENKGNVQLVLPDGAALTDVLTELKIDGPVKCSINEELQRDFSCHLHDGDQVRCFRPVGGG